jgi:DNA-binding response OmpR family regulator
VTIAARRRVLLVEDDADLADALRELLVDEGFDVRLASNGRIALMLMCAVEPKPDLIILDLMLPEISGWRMMDLLRDDDRFANIPVIVTTAASAAAPEGARQYFSKPLNLRALLQAVESHCCGSAPPP